MWTAVKLDGSWYLCDPTWNDPIYAYEGGTNATRDYSTKEYLMKADQASHIASTTYVVPPEISDSDYLVEEYGLTEDGRISGYEIGIGRMMIVLYDQDKMIGFGFCEAVQYGSDADGEEQVYIHYPPDFDRALLGQADRVVRIHVGETSWVPVSQLNVITRM